MKAFRLSLRSLLRDWRAGELQLILIAVIVAVSAVTAVGFFTDRVKRATEQEASQLLAADLILTSSEPVKKRYHHLAEKEGLSATLTTSFRSVVTANNRLQLSEVKAVAQGYPLYGGLRTAGKLFGEEQTTDEIPSAGEAWLDSRLMQLLGIETGDQIGLGKLNLTVSRVLTYEPDRGGDFFNIAPRVLINLVDLENSGLLMTGSRAKYRLLLGGTPATVKKFREGLPDTARDNIEVQDIRDARPELKSALDRTEQFLGLAAITSIALAGLAIALCARRFTSRHFDHCAIMRCIGMRRSGVFRLYLYQLLCMALLGSLLGCMAGFVFQIGLGRLLSNISNTPLPPAGVLPVYMGILTGVVTMLGFALPPLLRLNNVSPLRVLRRDLLPTPVSLRTSYLFPVLALALLTPWQSGQFALTAYTLTGLVLATLLLATGARLFLHVANRLRSRLNIVYRYGLANIVRRARQSSAQIVAIGLGMTIMLLLTLIRTDLLENWQARLPEGTPNYFLINIQPGETGDVREFVERHLGRKAAFYPMIRGRLVSINGRDIVPRDYSEPRAQRLSAREFNLSFAEYMQPDNRLVAGQWWDSATDERLFSVETGIAETLGIKMHDRLTYRVAGEDITGRVVNMCEVEWDSFNVNFFVIASPETLKDAPATYITSFHLPSDKKHLLAELVRSFPSITVIDVDAVLSQVRLIMHQVIDTIEYVFAFTLAAGIVVLLAALKGIQDERIRESALLFALGAGHRQVRKSLILEFTCLGIIAGLLAALAASMAEWLLGRFVLHMETSVNLHIWLVAPFLCAIIIVVTGLSYTHQVFRSPPMLTLREE